MADEPKGQQAPAPVPAEAPEAQPVPAEPTPTPVPTPAGPTLEQLANELAEAKQLISQANERTARAEHEANYTRNLIEQFGKGRPAAETTPQVPEFSDDEWLVNPGKAAQKLVAVIREQDRAEREKEKREQYVERAKSLFEEGKKTAASQGGKVIRGIEDDIANEIQRGVISGAINPESAKDQNLWEMTGMAIRYARGERNFDKYFGQERSPMSPVHTETPTAGGPPKDVVTLTDEERFTAKSWGITEEQMLAQKKQSMSEKERLAR
jgi:hypothetical protein